MGNSLWLEVRTMVAIRHGNAHIHRERRLGKLPALEADGLTLMHAHFTRHAFERHSHDT